MTALINLAFDDVFDDVTRHFFKLDTNHYCAKGKTPIVDQGEGYIAGYTDNQNAEDYVLDSAIVFGDHTRRFKFIDFPFCIGADGTKVLRPKINASIKYLYHYLNSLQIESNGYSRHFKFLKRKTFNIPPLAEQKRIAAILDKATEIKAKREQAISKLDELAASAFEKLFKSADGKLIKLNSVCEVTGGYAFKSEYYKQDGDAYVIRISDIQDGSVTLSDAARIDKSNLGRGEKFILNSGDVLVAMSGATIGKIGVLEDIDGKSVFLNQRVGRYKISDRNKITHEYLVELLKSNAYKQYVNNVAAGAAQPNISAKQLVDFEFLLPSIAQQKDFSLFISNLVNQKNKLKIANDVNSDLINALQNQAFTTGFNE